MISTFLHKKWYNQCHFASLRACVARVCVLSHENHRPIWYIKFFTLALLFRGAHLGYYFVGFSETGPLVVMLAVALPTFTRWMYVLILTLAVFGFAMFVLMQVSPLQ